MSKEESRFTAENRERKEMVTFKGMARTESGKLTKSNYFNFLRHDLDDYSDLEFTPEQARKIHNHLLKMSTGATSMAPMYCGGSICPFKDRCVFWEMGKAPVGKQCHPPGEKVLTHSHGYIPIEKLDPEVHKIISYERKWNAIRNRGNSFKIASRDYTGSMVTFTTKSGKSYRATSDHICIAKFNEKAVGKFCVYLMKKGDCWRVGKSTIISLTVKEDSIHKSYMNFPVRGNGEKADAMWILGVFDTNTEALLAEEFFSITFHAGKALFLDALEMKKAKWNGVYKWVTQEQLDKHHQSLRQEENFYREKLEELGLSIDYPIWVPNSRSLPTGEKLYVNWPMYIRACNVLPDIMDMPTISEAPVKGYRNKILASWESIKVSKEFYSGPVYSLGVEGHETYFVNDIATHNCLIEIELMKQWVVDYVEEFDIDPQNFTEIGYANELAEIMVLERRINMNLARPANSELMTDQTVGVDREGDPITQRVISPLMELKEKLTARRSRIIKLMVGDRQEKYRKEAALKVRQEADPSAKMSSMRTQLETLARQLDTMEKVATSQLPQEERRVLLSPNDIINEPSK